MGAVLENKEGGRRLSSMNRNKVNELIEGVENYLKELEGFVKEDELDDKEKGYLASFLLFQAINECINLGNHIVATHSLGLPEHSIEIFRLLFEKGFISEEIYGAFKVFIEFRNIVAHIYRRVDKELLRDVFLRRENIREFLNELSWRLKNEEC